MKDCMIIRGIYKEDGEEKTFRPATRSPDMHWAYMLIHQYSDLVNISVKWIDLEPMVTIKRNLHLEHNDAFEHIMDFAKLHNLEVNSCEDECKKCKGHPKCLGMKK